MSLTAEGTIATIRFKMNFDQVIQQKAHTIRNVIANLSNARDRQTARVGQLPVDVALAGDDWAGIAAAHRDDNVSPLRQVGGQQLRFAPPQVDPLFAHPLPTILLTVI